MKSNLGYSKELLICAFDHRGSFQSKLFGIKGDPTPEQTLEIASYKRVIFDGFEKAVTTRGIPKEKAGILCDEQFGTEVLQVARSKGYAVSCPAEKSGQDEFDFEYGKDFGAHIQKFEPTFVKVLVRYNTDGDAVGNARQAARLKELSEWCANNGRKFLFELLVGPTPAQLAKVGGDQKRFDLELRPALMVQAMAELQNFGIEPDIWKIEGLEKVSECESVAAQARIGGRSQVGVVVLGRGENDVKVREWLGVAAKVPAFLGFAVGRTIFWEPLKGLREGKLTRQQAVDQVAETYASFCDVWSKARAK